jgi:hypothetical protein
LLAPDTRLAKTAPLGNPKQCASASLDSFLHFDLVRYFAVTMRLIAGISNLSFSREQGGNMSGLVEEIQAKVLDKNVSTTELLRMVKLAATKLRLDETADWVDHELQGYPSGVEVPDYRQTMGQVKSFHPSFGVRSVGGDPEMLNKLSSQKIHESINQVETLAGDGTNEVVQRLPESLIAQINKMNGGPPQDYHVHITCAVFLNITQQVRNLILNWAVTLERKGILGTGISFTVEEKQKAAAAGSTISIGTFNGSFQNGEMTGGQSRTNVNSTDNSTNTITTENVFQQLTQAIESKIGNHNDRETILGIVKEMEKTKGTADYTAWFQQFMGHAADYVTVLSPFLPALTQLLS